jgi:crotonobetainyl-CoA:carnitine CoA-transferase CaiB-like acyl-CoA transferase
MYDLMDGVRVIEVAEHTFVPAAGMILADWGADVIKVERSAGGGDAARSMRVIQRPGLRANPFFEAANRGKRGIALNLTQDEGRAYLYRLIETADVFLTNLRDGARAKLGIDVDDLTKHNPRLIYARGSGYGRRGPLASADGFDYPSSWCRSGSAYVQSQGSPDGPPMQPGSVGDLTGATALAGAVSAALFRRERTGRGAVVDHALYLAGTYIMSQSLIGASLSPDYDRQSPPRHAAVDPLNNRYRTMDGRWLVLCLLYDAWWPDFTRHIGHEELAGDPRFATGEARAKNNSALISELDEIFAQRCLAEWEATFRTLQGVWSPVKSPAEVIEDEQALVNGFVTPVTLADGGEYLTGASPAQFDERAIGALRASPAQGEHTDEVLRELGITDANITGLRDRGVVA